MTHLLVLFQEQMDKVPRHVISFHCPVASLGKLLIMAQYWPQTGVTENFKNIRSSWMCFNQRKPLGGRRNWTGGHTSALLLPANITPWVQDQVFYLIAPSASKWWLNSGTWRCDSMQKAYCGHPLPSSTISHGMPPHWAPAARVSFCSPFYDVSLTDPLPHPDPIYPGGWLFPYLSRERLLGTHLESRVIAVTCCSSGGHRPCSTL